MKRNDSISIFTQLKIAMLFALSPEFLKIGYDIYRNINFFSRIREYNIEEVTEKRLISLIEPIYHKLCHDVPNEIIDEIIHQLNFENWSEYHSQGPILSGFYVLAMTVESAEGKNILKFSLKLCYPSVFVQYGIKKTS